MAENMLTAESCSGLIKTKELAKILGVSDRRLQMMTKSGLLHKADAEAGTRGVYRMPDVIREYRAALADAAQGHKVRDEAETDMTKSKLSAEVRYKEAKAKKAEVELKEYVGEFHRSDDVEKLVNELIYSVRNAMMAMPGRLASECVGKTAKEISEAVRKEVFSTLEQLSQHEYDPEKYRKLVRERSGLKTLDADDDEDED